MTTIDLQEYGKLEQKVEQLQKDVDQMKNDISTILSTLQQAKGGWRAMMFVSGIAGTLGAGLAWVATHITFIR